MPPAISWEKKRTRVLVFFFFLLGIASTKHCAEAAPILAAPGSRMVEGGRDQESFQALLTLEMRIAHVCLLNQKGEKAGCQFATLLQWSHAHCCCRPVCPVQMPVQYKPKKKKKNYLDSSASKKGINIKKKKKKESAVRKGKKQKAHTILGFTCYASIFCLYVLSSPPPPPFRDKQQNLSGVKGTASWWPAKNPE